MAKTAALLRQEKTRWTSASTLERTAKERLPSLEIPAFKSLLPKGLSRGIIGEINGPRSSSKTSACLYILAQATARGEICAVVDTQDSFCPFSAYAAGVQLDRLIWVRCRRNPDHALRITDLLLHAGGFGVILLDLCEVSPRLLNRIPLSYWYRFRRAVENTPSILLVCADTAQAKSCSSSNLELRQTYAEWAGSAPYTLLADLRAEAIASKAAMLRRHSLAIHCSPQHGVA